MSRERIDALREHVFDWAAENGLSAAEVIVACAEVVGGARVAAGRMAGVDVIARDAATLATAEPLAGTAPRPSPFAPAC